MLDGAPHPTDIHVGARVRLKRRSLGLSQERLADQVGVTFQQIQKYERGANRISASKLFDIAAVLDTPIAWFFEGLAAPGDSDVQPFVVDELLRMTDTIDLAQLWPQMTPAVRRQLIALMRSSTAGSA